MSTIRRHSRRRYAVLRLSTALCACTLALQVMGGGAARGTLHRWNTHRVSFCDLSGYAAAVSRAVAWWNGVPAHVRLVRRSCGAARVRIHRYLRRTKSVAGYAYYPPGGGVYLNAYWMGRSDATTQAEIAAHELGHALGLPHLRGCALMNPTVDLGRTCGRPEGQYACGPQRPDAAVLVRLYGGNLRNFEGYACSEPNDPQPPPEGPPPPVPSGSGSGLGAGPTERELGGVELDGYCRASGYENAVLIGPAQGPNAAYGWRCESGDHGKIGISVDGACRWMYADPSAYSRATDLDDAYSWRCYLFG